MDRQKHRETEKVRERETEREKDRETEKQRERQREAERNTKIDRERDRDRERQRDAKQRQDRETQIRVEHAHVRAAICQLHFDLAFILIWAGFFHRDAFFDALFLFSSTFSHFVVSFLLCIQFHAYIHWWRLMFVPMLNDFIVVIGSLLSFLPFFSLFLCFCFL